MMRTIISISEDDKLWLERISKQHKISASELVRTALRQYRGHYRGKSFTSTLQKTAGAWRKIKGDSQKYVDTLREEWDSGQ